MPLPGHARRRRLSFIVQSSSWGDSVLGEKGISPARARTREPEPEAGPEVTAETVDRRGTVEPTLHVLGRFNQKV